MSAGDRDHEQDEGDSAAVPLAHLPPPPIDPAAPPAPPVQAASPARSNVRLMVAAVIISQLFAFVLAAAWFVFVLAVGFPDADDDRAPNPTVTLSGDADEPTGP